MKTMTDLEKKLQKTDRKQAALYLFCNFVSLLLITSFSAMMFSPTVLLVFPEGGDSRKQMIAIFALALFGCVVFTIYAGSLFFRKKARQLGTLMALGASRRTLTPGLFREVLFLSSVSSLLGILAGIPFVLLLWNSFRLLLIDSQEMVLQLDFRFLLLSFAFFLLVVLFACFTAYHYLRRTDIIDVIQEEHKNEPVKMLGTWCGPLGIFLLFSGAITGYLAPGIYLDTFQAYPTALINLFYAPVFVGLYLIMLHAVVHGARSHRKHPYRNLIARSMMKFQGKQTVNNLLVSTVLIAGGCFAIFYLPMFSIGPLMNITERPYDYCYDYRIDQSVPNKAQITALADSHGLKLKDFKSENYLTLALDGECYVEEDERHFHYEYTKLLREGNFFSASSFFRLTGQELSVPEGTYYAISNRTETGSYDLLTNSTLLTNLSTGKEFPVSFGGLAHYDLFAGNTEYYVINDRDYEALAAGLSDEWKGNMVLFNIDGEDSYDFAKDFFYTLVASFGPECELPTYYDRVTKIREEQQGGIYWGDTDRMTKISFDSPDTSDFRAYFRYMPKIRILEQQDFFRSFAVFLMMFLFICIICLFAALIISYTRCMTIALNNRYVFDNLKRLGASPAFLLQEIKNQAGTVFKIPAMAGMTAMYLLYSLIMYGNDSVITFSEIAGLAGCLLVLLLLALLHYAVYRITVRSMAKQLSI